MKTPHTCCRSGKRVRVVLKSGESFVAKFKERTAKHICLFDCHAPVKAGDIKAFTIVKGNPAT